MRRYVALLAAAACVTGAGCGGTPTEDELPRLRDSVPPGQNIHIPVYAKDGPGVPLAPEAPGHTDGEADLVEVFEEEGLREDLRYRKPKGKPYRNPAILRTARRALRELVRMADRHDPALCGRMSPQHLTQLTGLEGRAAYEECLSLVARRRGRTHLVQIDHMELWGPVIAGATFSTRSGRRGKVHGFLLYRHEGTWLIGQGTTGLI